MGHPHRLPTQAVLGEHRYFLTICTHRRQPFFRDADIVDRTLSQFLRYASQHRCEVPAYCFMPDHVHLLVVGQDSDANLKRFLRAAKQGAGYQFTRLTGHRLWQDNYFDRTLRHAESLNAALRYLINNPIRAGLVQHLEDYPFWGSGFWTREELLHVVSEADSRT